MDQTRPYRPNVGIALFNAEGLVLVGRAETSGPELIVPGFEWQCPQGGIDEGEDIVAAAKRELWEETNVRSASLLAVTEEWWPYDFPPYDGPPHKLSPFRGQKQRWAALRFEGQDSEIDVVNLPTGEPQEFFGWRWERLARLPDLVTPHKRPVYLRMAQAFAGFGA
ncbi:RNA pyrophosphohydrolase [Labrys neptuniae]|uniref:RNA pyrophosphohydrolase n=1 Tax=Labrys neptuniae TaxID=376174 RepID=A0ABV3PXN6_9HYPH